MDSKFSHENREPNFRLALCRSGTPRSNFFIINIQYLKPHFVSEVRILRQYERSELVTCHVLFPLGNDSINLQGKKIK